MRLALVGQLVEVTEAGLRLHFEGKADFGRFYKDVNDMAIKFDNLLRLISPLPGKYQSLSFPLPYPRSERV